MRIAILVDDNIVVTNRVPQRSDCSSLAAEGISAVQWDGEKGHVEFAGHIKPNEEISDFAPFQPYIDKAKPLPAIANAESFAELKEQAKTVKPSAR